MIKNNYIYTNSNLILSLITEIINKSKKKKIDNECFICKKKFNHEYFYKKKLNIKDFEIHLLKKHNLINNDLYKELCSSSLILRENNIEWCLINNNDINIIDGLYEIGSNQIYKQKNKNIFNSKIFRFSEHSGFIYFEKNKISNISVINISRTDQSDPLIYLPKNCIEALKVNYIFHTHPKTPYIGSRIKNGIIYEFPSISDIIHFIEHHNNGKLLGSIIIAPEGIYIIRKNNFNKKNIIVDYDLLISDLEEIFFECYNDSYSTYSYINYNEFKINNEIKIPDNIFYEKIAINYNYINKINNVLIKYDLYIDYYARILLNKPKLFINRWILDFIYVPMIN